MGDHIKMSISGDSLLDETLNRSPWRYSCGVSMNFPLGFIQCNFYFSFTVAQCKPDDIFYDTMMIDDIIS